MQVDTFILLRCFGSFVSLQQANDFGKSKGRRYSFDGKTNSALAHSQEAVWRGRTDCVIEMPTYNEAQGEWMEIERDRICWK
jgi:hypothetical protein